MSADKDGSNEIALETIELLESRLRRLDFVVFGGHLQDEENEHGHVATGNDRSVMERLAKLENGLHQLASRSKTVQEVLKLQNTHPDLYDSSQADNDPLMLDLSSQLAIVLASAPMYHSTASRLTSIHDVPVPRAESSAALVALQPRVAELELLQESQTRQIAELRNRSAAVLERWYEVSVLSGGDCWDEWEGRVGQAERKLKRYEVSLEKEQSIT